MSLFKRIVVPVDFSNNSEVVIPVALDLAEKYGAELHLVHVLNFPPELKRGGKLTREGDALVKDFREAAEGEMHEYYDRNFKNYPHYKMHICVGDPAIEIVDYAREVQADLVVQATHGRTGLAHMLLGSTAEKVLRAGPCPVLTVKVAQ
ncbi:MAG: universal stress protein [Candidatus Methylomirabilis sp.]|nr:universal stress protein [Deltaproteobacteria bacterium]